MLNQNKTKTMNDILTKKEVSQFLKCSIGMVDKLMSNNLPYYKIGRNVKFKKQRCLSRRPGPTRAPVSSGGGPSRICS